MLWGSLVLFALVLGLFLLAFLRPALARRLRPGRWVVLGGLVLPIPVLTILLYSALFQGEALLPFAANGAEAVRVEARARQWIWEFHYPDRPDAGPTAGVLHIPAGRPVDVVAVSEDVIHSFWVPRLGGKIDATPGRRAVVRLRADLPGVYGGVCAEYCGIGHTAMTFSVVAHDPEDYAAALRRVTRGETRP